MPKMSKSPNTTDKLPPVHPGEVLKETLDDMKISMNRLSKEIHVPANRISSIIAGNARLREKQPSGWLDTLGPPRSTG